MQGTKYCVFKRHNVNTLNSASHHIFVNATFQPAEKTRKRLKLIYTIGKKKKKKDNSNSINNLKNITKQKQNKKQKGWVTKLK